MHGYLDLPESKVLSRIRWDRVLAHLGNQSLWNRLRPKDKLLKQSRLFHLVTNIGIPIEAEDRIVDDLLSRSLDL
jgi:hypothetical protein